MRYAVLGDGSVAIEAFLSRPGPVCHRARARASIRSAIAVAPDAGNVYTASTLLRQADHRKLQSMSRMASRIFSPSSPRYY